MARSRNIKPGFFLNEDLGNIPPLGRLLFIGLWTVADFKGDLEWRPQRLKAQLLPYDNCEISELANNLELYRFIRYYSANGMAYIHINNFTVHQNPHINEKKNGSSIPAFDESLMQVVDLKELAIKTEQVPIKDVQLGKNTADSLILIPDSLILIPDSSQDQETGEAQKTRLTTEKPREAKKEIKPAKTAATWVAYSTAYEKRYGAEPVRNMKSSGQLSQFIDRVGSEDAPGVAEFFLYHNNRWYIEKGHSIDCLLKDAESLRTQWATKKQITTIGARQSEKTSHNLSVVNQLIEENRKNE